MVDSVICCYVPRCKQDSEINIYHAGKNADIFRFGSTIRKEQNARTLFWVALFVGLVMSMVVISGIAETTGEGFFDSTNYSAGVVYLPASITISIGGNSFALYLIAPAFAGYALWASELVVHGENGWLVDIEDSQAIAKWAGRIHADRDITEQVILNARLTAEMNSYEAQHPTWRQFLDGFIELYPNR